MCHERTRQADEYDNGLIPPPPLTTFEDSEKESEYGYVRKVVLFSFEIQFDWSMSFY